MRPAGAPARARGAWWARAFVAVHALAVLAPLSVIAVWSVSAAWPWPGLLPTGFTGRGLELVFSGSQGAGLACVGLSAGIALASAGLATCAGALAARAVCCHAWRGRRLFEFATLLPFLIPSTVFAMGVQVAFIRLGWVGTAGGVVLCHAVVALPYATALMCDVTRAAGTRLEEAARTLGAGRLRTLVHVTLPGVAPGVVSALSMGYIVSFSQYFLTLLVGGGKVRTFALVLFPYLAGGDRTVAAAYGVVFIAVTFAVFALFELLLRRVRPAGESNLYAA